MSEPILVNGVPFNPVQIPATGAWQLRQLERFGVYILVHPNGRQAWFHEDEMNRVVRQLGSRFRYTDNPMNDLRRLAKAGLKPFHVDADFDPGVLLQ